MLDTDLNNISINLNQHQYSNKGMIIMKNPKESNQSEEEKTILISEERKDYSKNNVSSINVQSNQGNQSIFSMFFKQKQKEITMNLLSTAQSKGTSWIDSFHISFSFLDEYFKVNTDDVYSKAINGFIPFNKNFSSFKPDLYGPFWIYSTIIFVLSACGSLNGIMNSSTKSTFVDYVPVAAFMVSKKI